MQTNINAPVGRCFDLARSIDLHIDSVSFSKEQAVGGTTSGLIGEGEEVEWRARHFGFWLTMRVQITALRSPNYFQDVMVTGPFRYFKHDHIFTEREQRTVMVDRISFASPVFFLGKIVDLFILRVYLRRLIESRNIFLKTTAESNQWHNYLLS